MIFTRSTLDEDSVRSDIEKKKAKPLINVNLQSSSGHALLLLF